VAWQEHETQRRLREFLERHHVEARDCATTGLVADVGQAAPRVLYRGDIDALPIQEKKGPEAACVSERPGFSHACGHDVHATVCATLAVVFRRLDLENGVRFALQPAEEVLPSGGAAMVAAGVMEGIDAALAVHIDPTREVGNVGGLVGPVTASNDSYVVRVKGRTGHSARPHLARDAIAAAADVVSALYGVTALRIDPLHPAVLNVGIIRAGTAQNVIAGEAVIEGVFRTLAPEARSQLRDAVIETAQAAAALHGCEAAVEITEGAPSVVNDAVLHDLVRGAAIDVLGEDGFGLLEHPSTGAEDFAHFGAAAPQYLLRLGIRPPGAPTYHLHTPELEVDERAIGIACRVMGRALLGLAG
jgi:amidohydrolase